MQKLQGIPGVFFPINVVMPNGKGMKGLRKTRHKEPIPQGYINIQLDRSNWSQLESLLKCTGDKKPTLLGYRFISLSYTHIYLFCSNISMSLQVVKLAS